MGRTRNHGHYVCSTWGNNHFKTFDGDIYQFPGICEYNFASDCQESYKEFSVHIQRALNSNNHPEIQYILITMKDFTVYLRPKLAVVDGRIVKTPYYSSGLLIESNDIYTKVYAKLGLILIWNQEDALMVELDSKFNNHTCGLCGDYNGVPIYNEFINGVASYNSITYGNLQKISRPNTKCEDPDETQALPSCNEHRNECERLLTSSAFADCRLRLNLELYIQACMQDKCACNGNEDSFCLCSTISEYSRQCSHAGGRPGEWRTQYFCPKTCPDTMIYRESSSPCMDTCSHLEISSLCEEHYMDGCFCPEGTVYDDITEKGCILASQCHCKLHGKEYSPGESITNECEECTCDSGRWTCKDLPCPGTCSVEGGSHITTFDGKKYTFHGDCYYVLAKGTVNDSHALLAELSPCGSTDRQTCLKTVVLLADHKKNVVVFRSDGSVLLNEMTVNVPHVSASFSVFKPSSYYLVAQTSFGLQLQIQLFPVMQLFVTVDQSVQGKLQGLCGNFNGMEGDDFKTTSGLVEATGSAFANTWKAQSTCTDQVEKLEDPCSLSTESANYAEHWCSLLKNSEGPFARCHLIIDPSEYYKKCKYDTCLCEDNEECLCAALSSYSRACAFKGIILGGWRKNVCTSEMSACPGNQIFLYNLTMCQQTCRSLAGGEKHCLQDFPPMDGCGCPYNTYLDNQDTCVPISKCPCYYKGSYLEPGEYVTKDGERCVCRNAKVQCTSVTIKMKNTTECSSNKMYFDCNASPKWTSQTPLQLSCHTPRTDHFQAECVSGCVCPEGLFDDGKGGCVEEKDCPCIHNNQWYSPGQKIAVDCNTCTCQKGLWTCTEDVCYGTCMIYGSGHYITFDGKFYDFDGSCDYVATQDFCGDKNSSGSFSIITENVPCGTTGVTCSKAIKMFLGKTELKLENKDYKEIQRDIGDDVRYWNRTVGLYLVIEASNGVMLIWDKKTTVFIKLTPDYKGKVCGLCGNFDDKSNNDFTTRSGLQETNALKFGNSWKQSSMCPDITQEIKPCDVKPHRKSWAEKECSIIRSEVFKICHSKVDPIPFYEACVHDACSCDSGGDCECFCSAVAAYAQECTKAQACVFWRTPDICPIFCDYYNPRNECDWHYEPCGSNVTTCRMINNVSTNFSVPYLEGCYPRCPKDKPVYNEETKECVPEDQCWCYINGTHVPPGSEIPTEENCTKCVCGPSGSIQCTPIPGCPCVINGTSYEVGEIVAQIQDGNICITYICAENGSIVVGSTYPCPTSTSPTTVSTSFPTSTLTTTVVTTSPPVTTTPCFGLICNWTQWFDVSKPEEDGGDYETYDAIRKEHGNKICEAPEDIECRAKDNPDMSLEELGQKVECNVTYGLICKNEEQDATMWQLCYNYEIRVNCCEWSEISCETTSTLSPTPTATSTTTSTTVPITTTVRQSTAVTTMPIPTPTITSKFTSSVTTPVTSTSPAPPSSTTRTVSPPPVSTTAPTPTPSEPPSSTATTTMPPRSTTSSTLGTTTMVSGTPAPTPTTATTSMPTPTYTTTSSPPDCDCIWTDWIDVSYPNSSDRNSGDYETFENILKNDSSWVCAKAENISCRAEKFPHIPIADLGQKVECSVNTGLICNNSDQVIGGIIPMPVCLNYEISVCCIPNIPQCITSTTTSTTTAPPSSTTRTVSPPPVSTTAPTPTPSEPPSSTATTTMPPRSTTSSTLGTTTMVSGTPAPTPTTATTSMPTPTYTTTSSPPDCDCIWTDWIDVSYPNSSDRNSGDYETFENILKNDSSWVCAKAENISCRAEKFPHIPIADLGQKVECSVNTGLICNNSDQVIGGIIPMPVCLNYEISVCCIPNIPQCITSTTTSTTTAPPSSTTRTVSPPPVSTTAPTPTPSEPPSSTATTTMPPRSTTSSTLGTTTMVSGTPAPTPTTATTSMPTPTYTTTSSPPEGTTPESGTLISTTVTPSATPQPTTRTTEIQSTVSTTGTTIQQSKTSVSTSPVTVSTSGVTETGPTTKTTTSGPTPHSTTTVMETSSHETSTTGTGSPPTGPPSSTTSTTTSGPSSPMSTASTTVSPPPVSTSPVTVSTSGVTETGPTTKTTTSGPTPHSTTTVMETSSHETSTTGTGSPPTGPPSSTTSTTTSGPSSPMSTASTTVSPPPVSTSPVTVSTSGVTETGPTTKTTTSGPTPHSTTTVMETSSHETSTTGTGSPPTGPPSSTTSTTTSGPSSPMSTASTTVSPPPVSTSPVTVSTSGVTETGPTTKTTTSGPTPHSTTTVMETSSHETSTTGTGSPPTGPPSSTTSTTTSGPSSPMSTASTTVSPPPVSTSPVTVSTSGVTETGPTTKTTTSGPTPHSTTTVMETSSHETSTTGTGSPPTGPPSSTTSTTTSGPSSPMSTASTTVSPPPVSTSPVTVSTSGVTETGPTTKTTTSGPTPHSTTTVMETSSHETSTTGTGSPPTGPPSSTTSTTTSGPSSPMSTASTTVSPPPVSTSPVTVSTSGVTETGPTTKTTTSGPTPHSTTTVMETSSHETSTTGTGSPPTGPPSSTTSTTTSGPSSPMSTASTTVSPPPVSTSPVTVSTSGVTETGPTTKTTTSGPTPHSTTTVMETSSHETSTTGTGSPPTGPPSSTTSTTTSGPSSPMSTASTTVSPPPVSTSPVTVSTSGVTETGPTTKTTTSGPTPHSTTTVMETSSHETSTTGTGSPPTGPPSSTTSTTTSGPSSPMSTASTTVSPPPVSTSPVTVSTSGVTETGPTTKTTTSGPTPHSTTTVMETSSHETSTTGTGSPPTGPPSSTTSTTTSGPSSPMSTASTTVSPPPVSTSPVTVSTSGVTETGPTTKTTTSGPTPHSTTTVMETSSHETSTTGTGSPPTGPPSSTTSTTTSGPSSPMSTASTTVSPPPVSTSPVTVSTSGVTETGPTTKTTTSGPTPHSTTTVMETSSHETSTTGTGSPPTGPPSSTTSTTTSGPSSPMSTASTTVSPPPVSTSPVTVSTSGVTETGPTTKTTTSGPTPHSTTTVMETSSHETSTTGTGSPPTGPPSSTTSTTTSGPSSPMSTASTTVSPPPVSTSPVTVSTSGVTETGSTATSGPTLSGPTSHSTTTVTVTGSTMPTTATRTTPTRSTVITTTMTSGRSSIESTAITTLSPPSVSTSIMPVTTSGTTPTESFTTTSGTTSRNFTTITATTTTSSSEYFPPGSTSTSGPTATSSSVTITGSSTYSTVTPLSASSSTTSPPPTTPGRNCSVFPNESYAPGESWWICDCIKAICIEDNIIQVVPVICNPPPKPTCANGLSPVQVIDEDGCCWHWECDCYCTGWGDPHYMTFDGLYYSYQGNCTYVLVEEIHKKVDNFGVYIDNYHCDTRDVVSCPRTLIVRHETQEVRMATVKPNTLQVEVTVNKQAVALPYKKFGLSIYESGINRVVEIPELKMNVTYNGLSFSIRMPYSLFGNNTHGQCGTCNNNTADDCMLPNGNIAENCETMADHWQVVDPSKPQCSPGLIPTKAPSTTPRQPCKESSICELLLGSLFEPCHGFVQPEKYYAACVFDSCVLPNLDLECSSLQTYAATCADQSVCIDWRSHTNGVCSYKCPSDKEYRACGPIKEITCKSSQQNETSTKQVEGCFCPNGTMLYDSGVDVCVKTCGCVGVDKIPREFGEKFTIDCQDCICVEGGNGIVCEPHECAEQNKTSCDGEGFYEVNEVNSEDSCCPIVTCKCNTSLCTSKAPKCTLGFEVHSHIPSGQCCPVYQCVPKRVCVHQNAEFLPNSSVFVDKCQNCFCTNEVNISTQLNIILCEHIPCNTYCEPGYESQPVKGECCGRCVQTKCVIHTSHNSDLILSPGEFKNDPYNNCTIYSCVNIHNQLISSTSEITCPAFNEESCKPGTITFLPNGCCRTCAPLDSPTPCSVRQRKDFIVYKGCRSVDRVVMTECEGTCGTSSLYSAEANSMDHSCSCCRESRTTVREVELKCPTGHSVSHKYIYVESCSCQDTECSSSQSSELQSTEENDKASILNRIKRAISLTAK
ncbi:mucin-2 isoform X11 [Accipiter gentilis]|uniref:mucin-2 isoform X11 n=1 Tax=Astur gentilis TaxID=8957 RepID=UPI00210F48EE|nr:mucin-2 isoform X11 [Accipiter gentilis]